MQTRVRNNQGFSLPEVLIASAVLSFAVAAITFAISSGHGQSYFALHELRALSLAEALMEEIASKPYADPTDAGTTPGPDAGELDRTAFDNCDDYHGYNETQGNIIDAQGAAYSAAYKLFRRSVSVSYGSPVFNLAGGAIPGLTVTVTVTDNHGMSWKAIRFIPEP